MRSLILLLPMSHLAAQTGREMYLPLKSVSGVVVDVDGHPLSNVDIDSERESRRTDENGRFQLNTRNQAVVLRKRGYASYLLPANAAVNLTITLERKKTLPAPACSGRQSCESIHGWNSVLCFPRTPKVAVNKQGKDVDYGYRSYTVETNLGKQGIQHGAGPMWGGPFALPLDISQSVEFREIRYFSGDWEIIDARGKTSDGKYWRNLGRAGESASYRGADEETARLLDQMLDGFCVLPRPK